MNAEIEVTNKVLTMSEVAAKKMIFAIGEKGIVPWEQLNTIADVFSKRKG